MSTKKQRSEAAALLSSHRKRVTVSCAVCSTEFKGLTTAVYCSNACRQRAKYARMKAAKAAQ